MIGLLHRKTLFYEKRRKENGGGLRGKKGKRDMAKEEEGKEIKMKKRKKRKDKKKYSRIPPVMEFRL